MNQHGLKNNLGATNLLLVVFLLCFVFFMRKLTLRPCCPNGLRCVNLKSLECVQSAMLAIGLSRVDDSRYMM